MNCKRTFFALFLLYLPLIAAMAWGEKAGNGTAIPAEKGRSSPVYDLLLRIENKVSDFNNLQTDFVQEKNLAIFRNRIQIRGRIYLQKPHTIAWHVDEPVKYSVLVTDRVIRQWDEETDRVQEIPLSGNPVFRVVIDQLTAWFSGRYVQLLDEYDVRVKGDHPLELEFVPREMSAVRKIMEHITVTFREDERYLQKVLFQEISGDSTVLFFKNTLLNAPVDENNFRVGPFSKLGYDTSAPPQAFDFRALPDGRRLSLTG